MSQIENRRDKSADLIKKYVEKHFVSKPKKVDIIRDETLKLKIKFVNDDPYKDLAKNCKKD